MRRFGVLVLVAILIIGHLYSLRNAVEAAKVLPHLDETTVVLPVPLLRITALDYRGLASDFMFLKALVFVGRTYERKERPRVKEWEWRWVYNVLDASAGLDPYFYDPYYFANANLTWSVGLVKETNALLEKGSRYRDWDYTLPFYIGFNQFWFLQETEKASQYLVEASRRPGGSPMFVSLAARLAYKGHKTENAIMFLKEILERTTDNDERTYYEARIDVLKSVQRLEKAVVQYKKNFGEIPADINDLVTKKIIDQIPQVPAGGSFYLGSNGEVKATSDYMLLPNYRKK